MLPEISLNVLDIAQNSISAKADEIHIDIALSTAERTLLFSIRDNGCGMDAETVQAVTDPFYTGRRTRHVGLGIPFLKMQAEATGGSFSLQSAPGKGTQITALFHTDHIDCMPLGDISATIHALAIMREDIHFVYCYRADDMSFSLDTDVLHEILGETPFQSPEISAYIRDYLKENTQEINHKANVGDIGGI